MRGNQLPIKKIRSNSHYPANLAYIKNLNQAIYKRPLPTRGQRSFLLSALFLLCRPTVRLRPGFSPHIVGIFQQFRQAQYPHKRREIL